MTRSTARTSRLPTLAIPRLNLTPRHYTSFDQAAQEAGMSRIYGGIHYSFDNTAGLALGTQVGNYVISHELAALKTRPIGQAWPMV